MRRNFFFISVLFLFLVLSGSLHALDPTFMRNGEVYLTITGAPSGSGIIDGVYRMNDPEGALKGKYPKHLFKEDLIQNFAVDITREVFTISDPVKSTIGSNYMLKRQVLDNSVGLGPSSYETRANVASTFPLTYVVTERPTKFSHNITNDQADWGAHRYIHHDNRTAYGGAGTGTNIYRTNTNPGTTGQNLREVRGCSAWGRHPWGTFKALQGKETSPPDNPLEYLPVYANQALVLPYYPEKKWYEIPNGAWFNSWRCKFGDGAGPTGINGSPFPGRALYYYQCYRDYVTGTQFDWRVVRHRATNAAVDNYSRYPQTPFATTYKTSIQRGVIAACLDGCGGSRATPTTTEASDMIFHPAFMPYSNNGNPAVTVYSYTRTEGTGNFNLNRESGARNYSFVTFGNGAGMGKNDTRWIGVSKGETEANGKERDYVYYLGTSQIQNWIPTIKNQNITAVSVSNQWNEKGGIIFAFDRTSNQIIKFTLKTSNSNTPGVVDNYTTIDVSNLMNRLGANSSIDDIAADGFGNLYVSMTYPSKSASYNAPKALKYNFNDAISMTVSKGTGDAKHDVYNFRYKVDFRKSVWKISSVGQPLEEVGAAEIARVFYRKDVYVDKSKADQMPTPAQVPGNINALVSGVLDSQSDYTVEATPAITGESKLAIINAPTPPEVLSLGDGKSYLDIIGAYHEYPKPDKLNFSTAQNAFSRVNSKNLNLSTLYFFMVENYPIPEAIQDPKVSPDYDGDGRRSGFLSSIINADPSAGNIRYYWNLWMVKDHRGKPVIPPLATNLEGEVGSEYTVFYSPIPAGYVLTCKVSYDWYDYNTVKFGQTINQWKNDPKSSHKRTDWAVPSSTSVNAAGVPIANNATSTVSLILNDIFKDYVPTDSGDPAKSSAINTIASSILSDTHAHYLAFESVIATGSLPPPPPPSEEVARIQRCNPGGNVATPANWNPRSGMNPTAGYHGIDAQYDYYWRIDIASQSIFYNGVDRPNPVTGVTYSYITGNDYNYIANKLMDNDPKNTYYVNGKSDFQFRKNGDDLRWDRKLPELEATLEYPTLDKNGNKITTVLPLTEVEVKDGVEGGKKFKYIVLPAGLLPPTDPYVGTLRFKLNRMFEYGMFIFDDKGNQLMKNPIWLPKMLTIIGDTSVMVMDSKAPQVVFSDTTPNQLYGITGEPLVSAGKSQNQTSIRFTITDNNPWESRTSLSSHKDFEASNINYNKIRLDNITKETSANNLRPVFSNSNRYVRVYYDIPDADAKGQATSTYVPSWTGTATAESIMLRDAELKEDDKAYNKLFTKLNLELPFNRFVKEGNNFKAITIPTNYANNTPGYVPSNFHIAVCDSSGNSVPVRPFNVVIHIKDNILPLPFGEIRESKNSYVTYIPAPKSDMSGDSDKRVATDWYASLQKEARTAGLKFDNNAEWQGHAATGKVGDFGGKSFYALPYLNSSNNIISLATTPFSTSVTGLISKLSPGNIEVEDNVDIIIKSGATDNAGQAMSKLSFRYYDIGGREIVRTLDYPATWGDPGISYGSQAATTQSARIIFRESGKIVLADGNTADGPKFPLGIPIIIEARDDARDWDSYEKAKHEANKFEWGTLTNGPAAPNIRTFRTTLPVYGTTFEIRTIDRYQRR
jgi:hypothetical protein